MRTPSIGKSLLAACCFLLYWVVGHSRIWGVDAPLGTGLLIAATIGLLAFFGAEIRHDHRSRLSSFSLIVLGLIGTAVLSRLAAVNPTGNPARDGAIMVGLLLLPVVLIATGIQRLVEMRRTAHPR